MQSDSLYLGYQFELYSLRWNYGGLTQASERDDEAGYTEFGDEDSGDQSETFILLYDQAEDFILTIDQLQASTTPALRALAMGLQERRGLGLVGRRFPCRSDNSDAIHSLIDQRE